MDETPEHQTTTVDADGQAARPEAADVGTHRVDTHPVLGPPPRRRIATFTFDGATFAGYEGEPVAAALLAHGVRELRSSRSGAPRGAYCFIGHCFECRVNIDGRHHERACLTPLRHGMAVTRGDV